MLAAVDGTFASNITAPFWVTTHTWVSSIETSKPAKYSMFGLLFRKTKPRLPASGEEPPPLPNVEKLVFTRANYFLFIDVAKSTLVTSVT
jgi:hypothetical protein